MHLGSKPWLSYASLNDSVVIPNSLTTAWRDKNKPEADVLYIDL